MNRLRRRHGFTLLELLLVLVILGVLAALVVPRFVGRGEEAKVTAAQTEISRIGGMIDMFEIDEGRFPATDEGLEVLLVADREYLKGDAVPTDPWGNPYLYRFPAERSGDGYDLYSVGPDGRDGSEDDIGNW
jgi:general secretion pathway protein G